MNDSLVRWLLPWQCGQQTQQLLKKWSKHSTLQASQQSTSLRYWQPSSAEVQAAKDASNIPTFTFRQQIRLAEVRLVRVLMLVLCLSVCLSVRLLFCCPFVLLTPRWRSSILR